MILLRKVDDTMTKESIIIAALRLFLTRGYKSVSLIDVANEVGITKGGIYHYFSSKDDLLCTAFHFLLDSVEEKYSHLLSDRYTLKEVLHRLMVENDFERYARELFGLQGECSVDHVHFAIEIMRRFSDIQERVQRINVSICEAFAQKIAISIEKGELKSGIDSHALAANVLATVNGQKSLGGHFLSPEMRIRMMENIWGLIKN